MASIEELEYSIKQYETQLAQVGEALNACSNDTERASLENLKCDLQELLDLTRETLNEQKRPSQVDDDLSNYDDDPYAKEMALFVSELKSCEANETYLHRLQYVLLFKHNDKLKVNRAETELAIVTQLHRK